MRIMYCGFDDEALMKGYSAIGLPVEGDFKLYDKKEICENKYRFMISIDVTKYPLKKIEESVYMALVKITPYDVLQMFYNKPIDIRLYNKPQYLFHATPLYHLPYILNDGFLKKKNTWNYIFSFSEKKKKDCLVYTYGAGALLTIQTDNYKVINAQSQQYGIMDDVNIDDVVNIEFYLDLNLVVSWDKSMIRQKTEFFKTKYDYTKNVHNISYKTRYSDQIPKQEAYEFFNEWIF